MLESDNTKRVYPIVMDWKHYCLFHGSVGLVFGGVALLGLLIDEVVLLGYGAIHAAFFLFLGCLSPFVRYEVTRTEIRGTMFRLRIPIDSILEVFPTRGFIIHGCTGQGLGIRYTHSHRKRRFAMLAPQNHEDFLRELEQRAPHLMRIGDRLVKVCVPKYIG